MPTLAIISAEVLLQELCDWPVEVWTFLFLLKGEELSTIVDEQLTRSASFVDTIVHLLFLGVSAMRLEVVDSQ